MNKTTSIASIFATFALAISFNGVVEGQPPSFEQLRQQIKPAAEILLDWHNAQSESIDETKRQISANQSRIEREQQNRALEAQRAVELERALKEDNDRHVALGNVRRFDVELKSAILNLQNSQLRREAEGIQTAVNGLLNGRASASQIRDSFLSHQDNLKTIRDRQAALNDVQTFRNELASVRRTLRDNQLMREAQGIETELNRLTSQTPASQIQDSLRVQRNSLQSIARRQKDFDDQAEAVARQKEAERQAHQAWLNSPEGRRYQEQRAREAAERRRQEEARRRQLQQNVFNTINRFL